MLASIDFNEYLNLVQQVRTAWEALEEIARLRTELSGDFSMGSRQSDIARNALKLMDHPDAG